MPLLDLRVGDRVIRTTAEHPFWVRGQGWRDAQQLRPGDELPTEAGGWIAVEGVEGPREAAPVYNMEVEDYHTYFIGEVSWGFAVWAHNNDDCPIYNAGAKRWIDPKTRRFVPTPKNPAHNATNFQKYKNELRADMGKPHVSDSQLAGYMDELYRENATVGSGSTAAALRLEIETGGTVGGRRHLQKAQGMVTALQKWLRNNPQASPGDRAAAENVLKDLISALDGN